MRCDLDTTDRTFAGFVGQSSTNRETWPGNRSDRGDRARVVSSSRGRHQMPLWRLPPVKWTGGLWPAPRVVVVVVRSTVSYGSGFLPFLTIVTVPELSGLAAGA
jgi:hypothetical protein